jgi:lipopolysaccharide transport system ATP-binding protein
MNRPIIEVAGLSKCYQLGATVRHDTMRDAITYGVKAVFGVNAGPAVVKENPEKFWALKDVGFEVGEGEVVGVIGRNGAGKSTLLKILSRITLPTEGTARLRGRVASLLEVGTGFHPELTGRENIFLNGAILGMNRSEIRSKFDEIVAFAEVEKFLDTPVKRYSSGMYVRLAFAVAAHIEPEILIIDEVLAVGDAQFQKKCLGKMQDVSRGGRTVLFVSHNMGAIHSLTQRCIYLEKGKVVFNGETGEAVKRYLTESLAERSRDNGVDYYRPDTYRRQPLSEKPVAITRIWVNGEDSGVPCINMGEGFEINIELDARVRVHGANLSISIANPEGQSVAVLFSWDNNFLVNLAPGRHVIKVRVNGLTLTPGMYYADAGINQSTETTAWDGVKNYPLLEVKNTGHVVHWLHRKWGAIHMDDVIWEHEGC